MDSKFILARPMFARVRDGPHLPHLSADKPPRKIARLDQLSIAGLVAALDSPSGWQRDTAQRLLVSSGNKGAAKPLRSLAAKRANPKARLQALWALEGLEALTPEVLTLALKDPNASVRGNAARAGARQRRAGVPPVSIRRAAQLSH
jgi:hypothetical protein